MSNKTEFPNFFRTVPNDGNQGLAILKFASKMNWKRISILCIAFLLDLDNDYGRALFNVIKAASASYNVTLISQHQIAPSSTVEQARLPVNDMRNAEPKIIIFAGYTAEFKTVWSLAKSMGMTEKGFQWICSDGVSRNELSTKEYLGILFLMPLERGPSNISNPFDQELFRYWNKIVNIGYPLINNVSGLAPNEIRLTVKPFTYFAATCIDQLVYGFDNYLKANSSRLVDSLLNGILYLIGSYRSDYRIPSMFALTDIITPSGYVEMDSNGDRLLTYQILNVIESTTTTGVIGIDGTLQTVKIWTSKAVALSSYSNYTEIDTLNFLGNTPLLPLDSYNPSDIANYLSTSSGLGLFLSVLLYLGLSMLLISGIGFVVCRKRYSLKVTGLATHFIMLFALIIAVFDILTILDVPSPFRCNARIAIFPNSISVYYGLLYRKCRLAYSKYYSFAPVESMGVMNFRNLWKGMLFSIPNILISILWIYTDQLSPAVVKIGPGSYEWTCKGHVDGYGNIYLYLLLGYNLLLIMIFILQAFKTRNIELPLKEIKMIRYSIYFVGFLVPVAVVLIITDTSSQLRLIIRASGVFYIIIGNTASLFLYKLFRCRDQAQPKKLGQSTTIRTGGIKYSLPRTLLASSDQILPATAFVGRIDGIHDVFSEPKKKVLISGSPYIVWVCDIWNRRVGDSQHYVREVGEVWTHSQQSNISLASDPKIIELAIGTTKFKIIFEKQDACLKWKAYFSVWMIGNEQQGLQFGNFQQSREVEVD